ncbi:MAG: SCP2 sterol-binding domain-containing protein [Pseudomonadales bacterium]|nr:SCP2 sterol-binding domain-containing protein [Pseudomonadales bacterium]
MNLADQLRRRKAELAPHFKPGFLQRDEAVFQFHFSQDEPFYLNISGANFDFVAGTTADATINLFIDSHETCWGLLTGSIDGMKAFMAGKYRADGNIVLSQLLLYLFKSNEPTIVYEVQD